MTKKLNVEQQLLVTAAADEILETSSVHQQALIRMLAVASEHNLNAANVLDDLCDEMRSATARDIPELVGELRSGVPIETALAQVPGVVPESVVMALAAAQSQGLREPLNQALLNAPSIRCSEGDRAQDMNVVSKLTGLFWRYVFTTYIFTFLMLFITPQFAYMFEEFGLEMPLTMQLLMEISNKFIQVWYVFALILLAVGLFLFFKQRHLFVGYFTRWIPSRWQQPVLTKNARKDRSFSWVVQAGDWTTEAAVRFVSSNGIGVERSRRLAAAEKIEAGADVMEALSSERVVTRRVSKVVSKASSSESAGWILRKMSGSRELRSHNRGLVGVQLLIWLGDFFLLFLAGCVAISIFQCLIQIIEGMTEYV